MPNNVRHYLCERCGGIGKQPAGRWDGKAYESQEGVCQLCDGIGMLGFREVQEDEFWRLVGPQECVPEIVGEYPYNSHFVTAKRDVIAAIVRDAAGNGKYFVE